MRWIIVAAVLAVTPAAAQDACTQTAPCPIDLDVDETGFTGATHWNATDGEWLILDVTVWDDLPHDVSIPELGVSQTFYPWGEPQDTAVPFQVSAGEYVVLDDGGDNATLMVSEAPASAPDGQTVGEAVQNIPGPEIAAAIALLALLAGRRR